MEVLVSLVMILAMVVVSENKPKEKHGGKHCLGGCW